MAMNKEVLGQALAALVLSPQATPEMAAQITKQWTDIADVIIKHIQTNAVVTVKAGQTITVAEGIGVQVATTGTGSTITTGTGVTSSAGTGSIK